MGKLFLYNMKLTFSLFVFSTLTHVIVKSCEPKLTKFSSRLDSSLEVGRPPFFKNINVTLRGITLDLQRRTPKTFPVVPRSWRFIYRLVKVNFPCRAHRYGERRDLYVSVIFTRRTVEFRRRLKISRRPG